MFGDWQRGMCDGQAWVGTSRACVWLHSPHCVYGWHAAWAGREPQLPPTVAASLAPFLSPAQVRDRATLYLYQLQHAPQGPDSVDPHWRIPARALDDALTAYLAQPDTEQPFDLVGLVGR